jgi:hypothetical protein
MPTRQSSLDLLGVRGLFALFGDTRTQMTVICNIGTLDVFDPAPLPTVDLLLWDEPDPGRVPTGVWDLAAATLRSVETMTVDGTDVIIASGASSGDRRSFAVPKAVRAEAARGIRHGGSYGNGISPVALTMAKTLSTEPSVGIDKVRHVDKALSYLDANTVGDERAQHDFQVSWLLWGGDPARRWASGIVRRDAMTSLAAEPAQQKVPEPPAEPPAESEPGTETPTDTGVQLEVPPSEDGAELTNEQYVEEVLGGVDWDADEQHPYLPDQVDGDQNTCQICGGSGTLLIHQSEDAPTVTSAQAHSAQPAQPAQPAEPTTETPAAPAGPALSSYFAAYDPHSRLTELFARQSGGRDWFGWDPAAESWDPAAAQADVIPLDDDAAHSLGALLHDFEAVPVPFLNQDEWGMVEDTEGSPQDIVPPVGSMDEVDFGIRLEDGDLTLPKGLFIVDALGQCWEWEPSGDWAPIMNCPDDIVLIDSDTAAQVAVEIAAETGLGPDELEESFEQAAYIVARSGTAVPDSTGFDGSDQADDTQQQDYENYASLTAALPADNQYRPPKKSNAVAYTPAERAQNAAQQFRDSLGRFAKVGAVVNVNDDNGTASVTGVNPAKNTVRVRYANGRVRIVPANQVTKLGDPNDPNSLAPPTAPKIDLSKIRGEPRATATTPKATLPKLLEPMDASALHKVITDYQAFIEEERRRKLESYAAMTPENSDVKPVYLAQVDPMDKTAVIDLFSLVPSSATSSTPALYARKDTGWVEDPQMMSKLKSANPPPMVVLDEETYPQVLEQVDGFYKTKAAQDAQDAQDAQQQPDQGGDAAAPAAAPAVAPAAAAASYAPQLWDEYGRLLPAVLTVGDTQEIKAVIAAGVPGIADTPSDVENARRLKAYWLHGAGAAKIRWNTPGDWTRCRRHLFKYMGDRAAGYCQNLHKEATGVYTGSRYNVGNRRGSNRRGLSTDDVAWTDDEIETAVRAAGVPGIADTPKDIEAAHRLKEYWLHGAGAAKIRWNTPDDWKRCVRHLTKYMGERSHGYCQNLHKEATGVYTGDRRNVGGNGRSRRRGLSADDSALLLAMPTRVLGSTQGIDQDQLTALVEVDVPSVFELVNLGHRDYGHRLSVGERFLVDTAEGVYAVNVLDPAQTLGWQGRPAALVQPYGGPTRLLIRNEV